MTDLGVLSGLHVTLYDEPMSMIAANVDTNSLSGFIQYMHDTFGPYPFGTDLRYVVGPTVWWGFEHPGNIVISDTLAISGAGTYADPLTHVMMHEFAHQYAGDQTTLAGTYDFVWKESMVEYLAYTYEDEHLAPSVGAATRALWKGDSNGSRAYPVPAGMPPLSAYYGYVYGEGPEILFLQIEGCTGGRR